MTARTCWRAWPTPARRSQGPGWEMAKANAALRQNAAMVSVG